MEPHEHAVLLPVYPRTGEPVRPPYNVVPKLDINIFVCFTQTDGVAVWPIHAPLHLSGDSSLSKRFRMYHPRAASQFCTWNQMG